MQVSRSCRFRSQKQSSKHAGSDPEAFWLRPVMAITASVQPELGRIVHAGSDFPHPFQSVPVLQRRHGPYCAKPARIRSGWTGRGLAKRTWAGSKLMRRIYPAGFLAGRKRPATSFPHLDSVPFFHRRPG